jgi:hypothetical protein
MTGLIRREPARAMSAQRDSSSIIARRLVVVQKLDLVDLVRGPKTVEEVQERHPWPAR